MKPKITEQIILFHQWMRNSPFVKAKKNMSLSVL